MKGSYFLGNRQFAVREASVPVWGENDVLIRTRVCGICGTDVHIYHGEAGPAAIKPPVVLGHEFSGLVEQIGPRVTNVSVGDKVTVDPNIYCGTCHPCQNGKKHLCERLSAIGVNRDGGFADYCVVPSEQVFVLDEAIDYEAGAMTEPLACCLHGIDRAGLRAGDTVLVIGGGAIGLLMVQLARLAGASRVWLSEPVKARRDIGLQVGADAVFDPRAEDPAAQIRKLTGRDGADVIIECVGRLPATEQAFACAAKGAVILLFSVPKEGETFPLHQYDVFKKELTILGSFVNPDTHARAAALLGSGRIAIKPLITHRFGIHEVEQAILAQMSDESIKVVVRTDL